jgi:hypothetical protein
MSRSTRRRSAPTRRRAVEAREREFDAAVGRGAIRAADRETWRDRLRRNLISPKPDLIRTTRTIPATRATWSATTARPGQGQQPARQRRPYVAPSLNSCRVMPCAIAGVSQAQARPRRGGHRSGNTTWPRVECRTQSAAALLRAAHDGPPSVRANEALPQVPCLPRSARTLRAAVARYMAAIRAEHRVPAA